MTPGAVLLSWFRGLLAILIVAGCIYLLVSWYEALPKSVQVFEALEPSQSTRTETSEKPVVRETPVRLLGPVERITVWRPGLDWHTGMLATGLFLLLWATAGRFLHPAVLFAGASEPAPAIPAGSVQRVKLLDGTDIHVEARGNEGRPTVVLTHGWSLSSREWDYIQQNWGGKFRVVTWDLPGLGQSNQPANRELSLEYLARALRSVLDATSSGPAILIGHSIGGMIILTFCRLFPELLGPRITKLVLIHTTYVNPLRTMRFSALFTALQKPLVEPLLYLQIALSPIVRILNVMSYWNGSIHSSVRRNGFSGPSSRSRIDFVAQYYMQDSPAVLARGSLGMLAYDATTTLPSIKIPVLVVGADSDPITLNEASRKIATDLPVARLTVLAPAKHFGLLEYDKDLSRQIADFCTM